MAKDPENTAIAERLEAFAALLDLAGSSYYTARAYRRAAELIRATPAPVAPLVRKGRVRELRGIGPGIERRLVELVETGRIAELDELERTVQPEIVGLGRLSVCRRSARWTWRVPWAWSLRRSFARRRGPGACARCQGSARSGRARSSRPSSGKSFRGLVAGCS